VVDLESGKARSVLDGHPSTQPDKTIEVSVDGKKLQRVDGRGFLVAPTASPCRATARHCIGSR